MLIKQLWYHGEKKTHFRISAQGNITKCGKNSTQVIVSTLSKCKLLQVARACLSLEDEWMSLGNRLA